MPDAAAQVTASPARSYELTGGAWYAAALDTAPLPPWLVEAPLRETLSAPEHNFGSLRVYTDKAALPADVGPAVREAKGATTWITGQFLPPGGSTAPQTVPLPEQVRAIEKLRGEPGATLPTTTTGGTPATTGATAAAVPTSTLVLAVAGVVVVGGGAAFALWWVTRPKKNPKKKRKGRR